MTDDTPSKEGWMSAFSHMPPYAGEWDGHTTAEKYAAIQKAVLRAAGVDE